MGDGGTRSGTGHFTSAEARQEFDIAYERAMSMWPPQHSRFDIETRFGTTRVYRHGAGHGEPIVLLHGHGANAATWYRQIEALGTRHPVYAVDIIDDPGGSVQRLPMTSCPDVAAWLDEVLEGLDLERVHLVGQSYGGWVALNQGIHGASRLARLTLLDPGGLEKVPLRFLAGLVAAVFAMQAPASWRPRLAKLLAEAALAERPEIMAPVMIGARAFRPYRSPARLFTDEEMRTVTVPTQVILARRTRMMRPDRALARARRLLPLTRGEIVPGVGHGIPQEAPDLVNERILSFTDEAVAPG